LIDPSAEGLGKHIEQSAQDHKVASKTDAGAYMIRCLNLNSKLHVHRRTSRAARIRIVEQLSAVVDSSIEEIAKMKADGKDVVAESKTVELLKEKLAGVETSLLPPPPFDAPTVCEVCSPQLGRTERTKDLGIVT
jgi:hypothetical protein